MENIAIKTDANSVSIDTFSKLLLKTDNLITKTDRLITLQRAQLAVYDSELNEIKKLVGNTEKTISISIAQSKTLTDQLKVTGAHQKEAHLQYQEEKERLVQQKRVDLIMLHAFSVKLLGATTIYRGNMANVSMVFDMPRRVREVDKVYDILCEVQNNREAFMENGIAASWSSLFSDVCILRAAYSIPIIDENKMKDTNVFFGLMKSAGNLASDVNVYCLEQLKQMGYIEIDKGRPFWK